MKEVVEEEGAISRDGMEVAARSTVHAPRMVPRVDYERILVLGEDARLLGEYALRDDCPLEYDDLRRSIPVNGMRHLVAFYQGEYAFTPFRVEDLWFVVLTHGVPPIEDRGSIGTLLAAMRVHLPPSLSPAIGAREDALREREQEAADRESKLSRREQRVSLLEAELRSAAITLRDLDSDVRTRERRVNALRDYAVQMQRSLRPTKSKPETRPVPDATTAATLESSGSTPP